MRWSARSAVRRLATFGVVLAVTTGLAACSAGETARTPAAGPATQTSSPSPGHRDTVDQAACRTAQLTVLRGLEWPLTQVVWMVTGDVDGASTEASSQVRRAFDRGQAKLREPCGGLPEEMAAAKRTVLAATAAPLDGAGLGRLDRAADEWARRLGAARPPLADVTAWVKHCRELGSQLRTGYTVGWEYIERGRRWWVEMVVDSDLPTRVWVDIGGTLWATGLPRDPYSRDDRRGGQRVEWGGSSADSLYAQPFTRSTTQVYLPGPSGYLHAAADSRVYGVRPEVFVRHGGGPACSLPVHRLG